MNERGIGRFNARVARCDLRNTPKEPRRARVQHVTQFVNASERDFVSLHERHACDELSALNDGTFGDEGRGLAWNTDRRKDSAGAVDEVEAHVVITWEEGAVRERGDVVMARLERLAPVRDGYGP